MYMLKRTTIELDTDLLTRAKRALGLSTTRAAVEEALRRVADAAEQQQAECTARQLEDLRTLGDHLDLQVLASDDAWR